jgi:hypothetical protein
LNEILSKAELDHYEFEQSMDITNIGCVMLKLLVILGGKNGAFFTQESAMFVDAAVWKDSGYMMAKVDSLDPRVTVYLLNGFSLASDCCDYIHRNR